VLPAAKVALTGTARKAQEIALSTTMRVGRLAEGATGKALPTISRGPSRIKGLSLDDQAALASRHVGGLSSKQAKSILQVARNGENPSSVVFGGSRVRGNFGPGSDVDIGFGHLNKNQARKRLSKIRHDAAKNGGLVPGEYQIVPNRAVTGHAPISTPEEFFQRSGIRVQEDGFEAFGPSGSITFDVDGTVTIWPPVH
jgi:hypothetical protein